MYSGEISLGVVINQPQVHLEFQKRINPGRQWKKTPAKTHSFVDNF